jgi:methoxymalonate biosynthesis acyl carrier protein
VTVAVTEESVKQNLLEFLEQRTTRTWDADEDLFDSGLVNSLFALELVVHVENTYAIAIGGDELTLDNFRTVSLMTKLVLRLRDE